MHADCSGRCRYGELVLLFDVKRRGGAAPSAVRVHVPIWLHAFVQDPHYFH